MTQTSLVFGAASWLPIAIGVGVVLLTALAWGYRRAGAGRGVKAAAVSLKALGILVLLVCLLEPLFSGTRARPGANAFVVLADDSQSMTLRDRDGRQSRAEVTKALADRATPWLAQLRRDFDVRSYAFADRLRAVADGEALTLDGRGSNLGAALDRLVRRYHGRPLAGVLLVTDGTATDVDAVERLIARQAAAAAADGGGDRLPPVYVVPVGSPDPAADVGVGPVTVTQTNFEDAPVTLTAPVTAAGYAGRTIVAQLVDEAGVVQESQQLTPGKDGEPLTARFRVRPPKPGVSFYRVRAAAEDELAALGTPAPIAAAGPATGPASAPTAAPPAAPPPPVAVSSENGNGNGDVREATLADNVRTVSVDRGRGPYRVLYVAGRPNWEFKFLQRAVDVDREVELVGLLRVAKREPKFAFLGRRGESSNPLFRGFGGPQNGASPQDTGEYDKPVMVRVGTKDAEELRGGFPKTAEELDAYHAVVLDDIEAEFFTQDQLLLLKDFVRQRGGGLLMLGGQESFKNAKFDRTPVGDLMPVYADEVPPAPRDAKYKLALTREGWLEPWVRLRPEEAGERQRVDEMPPFLAVNQVRGIKPGATVLARVTPAGGGDAVPALVEQRFGQGRVGALLIGDLWRWGLRRPRQDENDMEKAWRQTVRWLVADVPKRVELTPSARPADGGGAAAGTAGGGGDETTAEGAVTLAVQVRDPAYAPLDTAAVTVRVTAPDGSSLDLPAEPSERQPGRYEATYVPRLPGAYRARATAAGADGNEVGQAEAGWAADPAADEFKALQPNRELLARLAAATGGQVVEPDKLDAFVRDLPARQAQVTDPYVAPVWHTPWVFLLAIACLAGEWGLRRWKGLP